MLSLSLTLYLIVGIANNKLFRGVVHLILTPIGLYSFIRTVSRQRCFFILLSETLLR